MTRLDLLYGTEILRPEFMFRIVLPPWWRLDLWIQDWMDEWDERFAERYKR